MWLTRFKTIEQYGADATRWYLMTNASPWENMKFDLEGIKEVQRKFFGTLYNTYQFFALYANVDGFYLQRSLYTTGTTARDRPLDPFFYEYPYKKGNGVYGRL